MKQSQILIIGVIVLAVIGGGVFLSMQGKGETQDTMMEKTVESTGTSGVGDAMAAASTFTVTGSNFSFDVKEIKVKKGDTVKIIFKNADGFHDWIVDEFNAKTKQIGAGQEETITFVADKTGTFEYYCSVGQHRKNGMVGKLIVE